MTRKNRTPEDKARREKQGTAADGEHRQHGGYPKPVQENYCRIYGKRHRGRTG